jgi:hypothetical protein
MELAITIVKDGSYLGVTNGTKVLMVRDAFGVVTPTYKHLIPIFEDNGQTTEISPIDMAFLLKEFEASIDTIAKPAEPLELRADELLDSD